MVLLFRIQELGFRFLWFKFWEANLLALHTLSPQIPKVRIVTLPPEARKP